METFILVVYVAAVLHGMFYVGLAYGYTSADWFGGPNNPLWLLWLERTRQRSWFWASAWVCVNAWGIFAPNSGSALLLGWGHLVTLLNLLGLGYIHIVNHLSKR